MAEQVQEQVEGVVSAEADLANRTVVQRGILGAETSGASPKTGWTIRWTLHGSTVQAHVIDQHPKTLTERFNEAYDEEAKREDEEFVKRVKRYHRRRFSDEW